MGRILGGFIQRAIFIGVAVFKQLAFSNLNVGLTAFRVHRKGSALLAIVRSERRIRLKENMRWQFSPPSNDRFYGLARRICAIKGPFSLARR